MYALINLKTWLTFNPQSLTESWGQTDMVNIIIMHTAKSHSNLKSVLTSMSTPCSMAKNVSLWLTVMMAGISAGICTGVTSGGRSQDNSMFTTAGCIALLRRDITCNNTQQHTITCRAQKHVIEYCQTINLEMPWINILVTWISFQNYLLHKS